MLPLAASRLTLDEVMKLNPYDHDAIPHWYEGDDVCLSKELVRAYGFNLNRYIQRLKERHGNTRIRLYDVRPVLLEMV